MFSILAEMMKNGKRNIDFLYINNIIGLSVSAHATTRKWKGEKEMRTVRLEHMRPDEILRAKEQRSLAYLPLGPLEWHTPALPYGTDPFLAHALACRAAERTGGVVMPPLFMGSDCPRPSWHLEKLGFEDTEQYIVGMDFPKNKTKSFYLPPELVALIVKAYVALLAEQGYRLIVIINGHGAATQGILIDEICKHFTNTTNSKVIDGVKAAFASQEAEDTNHSIFGHANISEASLMMYLTEDVDMSTLPGKEEKLAYADWGIVDRCALFGDVSSEGYVVNDPREGTTELGKQLLDEMVKNITEYVEREYTEEGK